MFKKTIMDDKRLQSLLKPVLDEVQEGSFNDFKKFGYNSSTMIGFLIANIRQMKGEIKRLKKKNHVQSLYLDQLRQMDITDFIRSKREE